MTEKVHGMAGAGQFLTGGLDFYTIRTILDIRPTGVLSDESQQRLDKLVETISTRAQPVFLSAVAESTETDPVDIPAASGSVSVYTLKFAIEHHLAWEVAGSPEPSLAESLDKVAGFVYELGFTVNNNVSVTLNESL